MKKFILFILLLTATVTGVNAQKGMMGIGVDLGLNYDVYPEEQRTAHFGGLVKFQFNASNHIRLQPYIGIYKGFDIDGYLENPKNDIKAGIDMDIFFSAPRKTRFYALIGLGYAAKQYVSECFSTKEYGNGIADAIFAQAGFGLCLRMTHNLSMDISLQCPVYFGSFKTEYELRDKSYYIENIMVSPQFNIGVAYNF